MDLVVVWGMGGWKRGKNTFGNGCMHKDGVGGGEGMWEGGEFIYRHACVNTAAAAEFDSASVL